ncbi:Fe-only nitrogenase accessory AnfO family protein [Pectinatus haikarae]|uniref:Fe-only nitrogenase accessory protein AnfO n=1 Tax=Pectinatus haikarae TaxID=349096 RepID=A0ABT9Y5X4_9FIRM|nr:Fe-only nitrogenase accessory AnfO family protein [Pectinatus haikarae]MDQ0202920.1 Fe-only nitrogenase accessory protein AnfO [Pectinatus haikarae]
MNKKIAVTCDKDNQLTDFASLSHIIIFENNGTAWKIRKRFPFNFSSIKTAQEIRDYTRNLILKLDDCKIIASRSINGLIYNVFDRMRFAIFEIDSLDDNMLDKIITDIYNSLHDVNNNVPVATAPVETTGGIYYLDLIKLQNAHPDISSKKALRAFIDNSPFIRLDLVCSHIPAWLKSPEYEKKLDITTRNSGSSLLVSISKKCLD